MDWLGFLLLTGFETRLELQFVLLKFVLTDIIPNIFFLA